MSSLSQKDKNTLIIAGIALLIVGIIILGIKPAITSIGETKEINSQLSETKAAMQAEIESLPTYETGVETAKSDYDKLADKFFKAYDADMIHDEVLTLVNSAALDIEGLSIGDITEMGVGYYTISEDGSVTGASEGSGAKMAYINVNVKGSTTDIKTFANVLNLDEGIFIDQISFTETDEEISVAVTFYMVLAEAY